MNLEQAQAIAEVEKLGAKVTVDESLPGKPQFVVDLSVAKDLDAGLQHLKGLIGLRFLDLGRAEISDAGLEYLKGLPQILGLNLAGPKITDAGLEHLKALSKLEWLFLVDTERLTNVKWSDAWQAHLQGLAQFQSLETPLAELSGQQGNGSAAASRVGQALRKVPGAGFLAGLTNLRYLFLTNAKVTDAGIGHLQGLIKLQRLTLMSTRVTEEGVRKLQHALPGCHVARLP